MHIQVVHDRVHALNRSRHLGVHVAQEIDTIRDGTTWIALRPAIALCFPQRAKDIALAPSPIIDFLRGTLRWTFCDIFGLLTRIALGTCWSHLVDIKDRTVGWCFQPQPFKGPLFCAKSGSTRSPNHVSSCRQRKPSCRKISKMRVFFMEIPSSSRT